MQKFIIACLFSCLTTLTWAETKLESSTTTGFGSTYQEALSSALFEAVRQIRGATVGNEKQLRADLVQAIRENSANFAASIEVEEKAYALASGWVDSYTVKSIREPSDADGRWKVVVDAKIPVHESVIKDQGRKRIAVMPFRFTHSTFALDETGKLSNSHQISGTIRDRVLTALTQTRQFVVVNRSFGTEFRSEKALLSSDNVPPSEASRLGNVVGADFMVVGNINDLSTKTETKSFYGATKTTTKDKVDLSYQVIEVATQKILWADTIATEIKRDKDSENTDSIEQIAGAIVSGVMDVLFPIKVLDVVDASQIYLNQGQARVKEGDVFALFTEGRTLKDPDTGIDIKIDGKKVAELNVDQVSAQYSIASLKDGELKRVKKGDIVRKLTIEALDPHANKEVRYTPGSDDAPVNWGR